MDGYCDDALVSLNSSNWILCVSEVSRVCVSSMNASSITCLMRMLRVKWGVYFGHCSPGSGAIFRVNPQYNSYQQE